MHPIFDNINDVESFCDARDTLYHYPESAFKTKADAIRAQQLMRHLIFKKTRETFEDITLNGPPDYTAKKTQRQPLPM